MIELRYYQEYLAQRACKLLELYKIAYLAMQTRTGKTLTALKAANLYGSKCVLFVTKKKAITSINIDNQKTGLIEMLTVINYEQLHKYIDDKEFDLIIIDEAHSCGAFPTPSLRARQLKAICKNLPILFLSGTPTPESYSQIFHQLWISSFSPFCKYTTFYKWAKDYVYPNKKYFYNREVNDYSKAKELEIKNAIGHIFLSYSQKEAGFAQEVKEEILYIEMDRKTYWLADKILKERVYIGAKGEEIIADTEVKLQNKLHQIYSGTVKAEDGTPIIFDTSKACFIKEHFKGKKIAIFYKYQAEGEMLRRVFGGNITESPEHFNASDSYIFISQIQSGREGINLSTADALIMFNIDFSSLSYWQARDRIQVIDRSKSALLYWIFSKDGIERKIYDIVQNKKDYTLSYFRKDYDIKPKESSSLSHRATTS